MSMRLPEFLEKMKTETFLPATSFGVLPSHDGVAKSETAAKSARREGSALLS